jgi:signal transduction histidine kinase
MPSDSEQKQGLESEGDSLLGRVVRDIAHHVNGRIGLIRLAALTLLNDPVIAESPSRRKEVEKILRYAEAASRLPTAILQPYRELEPGLVKVDLIIKEAVMPVGVLDDVTLLQEIALGLPKVAVDRRGAISVFHELLANALRAVRAVEKPKWIKISAQLSNDGYVEVLFGNNGPAIPKERWETIFEQFAVADKRIGRGEGFGLGLWTARTFLRRQGGEIRVLDSDSAQTTFIIRLPVAPAEE